MAATMDDDNTPASVVSDEIKTAFRNLMKDATALRWFGAPVDAEALGIPDYHTVITSPMDLGTVQARVVAGDVYTRDEDIIADVHLTFRNAIVYNPETNTVHKAAKRLTKKFDKLYKTAKTKRGRKRGANGVGGRGKKGRFNGDDPAFKTGCIKVLEAIIEHDCSGPFLKPVDPAREGLPDYLTVIPYPMDLSTVKKKLMANKYGTEMEFATDVSAIWANCVTYNGADKGVSRMARQLSQKFDRLFTREFPMLSAEVAGRSAVAATAAVAPLPSAPSSTL